MSINIYKALLAVCFSVFAVLQWSYISLNKDSENIEVLQKSLEKGYILNQSNDDKTKGSYWEVLQRICKDDRIQLIKLENNDGYENYVKADLKIDAHSDEIEKILDYIVAISDSFRINRISIRENRGIESTTVSLEFTNNE